MAVRLFIGNLPYGASEADLRAHFSAVAEPSHIVMPVDRETGRPRGFAFVEFAERDEGGRGHQEVRRAAVPGPQPRGQRGTCARRSSAVRVRAAASVAAVAASAAHVPAVAAASAARVRRVRRRWWLRRPTARRRGRLWRSPSWWRRRGLRPARPGRPRSQRQLRSSRAAQAAARRKKGSRSRRTSRAVQSRNAAAAASTPWTTSRTPRRSTSTTSRPAHRRTPIPTRRSALALAGHRRAGRGRLAPPRHQSARGVAARR